MPVQRKKKAPKRRNPCLPCNPSTRVTRLKRNPNRTLQYQLQMYMIRSVEILNKVDVYSMDDESIIKLKPLVSELEKICTKIEKLV